MKREKKTHEQAKAKLVKLQSRRAEMSARQETAKAELGNAKTLFGMELIDGGDIEELSAVLSQKEAALTIISAGVEELDSQIASQQRVVAKAEVSLANAETRATMPRIVKDAVALIELLANSQIDIHLNLQRTERLLLLRQQHGIRGGLHNIKWEEDGQLRAAGAARVGSGIPSYGEIQDANRRRDLRLYRRRASRPIATKRRQRLGGTAGGAMMRHIRENTIVLGPDPPAQRRRPAPRKALATGVTKEIQQVVKEVMQSQEIQGELFLLKQLRRAAAYEASLLQRGCSKVAGLPG